MWMFQGRRGNQEPESDEGDSDDGNFEDVQGEPRHVQGDVLGKVSSSDDAQLARSQRIIRSLKIENEELQRDLDKCHRELKKLSSRPVVQAELEPDLEVVQAELEPEPEPEDLKTRGWVRFVGATTKYHGSSAGGPAYGQISNSDRIEWRDSHGEEYIKLTKKYAELAKPDAGPNEYFYLFECRDRTLPEKNCRIPWAGHTIPEHERPLNAEDWLRAIDNMAGLGYPPRNSYEASLRLIDKMKPGLLKELRIPAPTGTPPRYLPSEWKRFDQITGGGWGRRNVTDYDIYVKPGVSLKVLSEKILELKTPREFRARGGRTAACPEGIAKTDPKHHPRLIIVVENEEDRQNLIEINPEIQRLILPWNSLEELNSVPLEEIRLWFSFNAEDFNRVAEREGYNRKYVEIFLPHLLGSFNQKASMKPKKTKKRKKKPKKSKNTKKKNKNKRKATKKEKK